MFETIVSTFGHKGKIFTSNINTSNNIYFSSARPSSDNDNFNATTFAIDLTPKTAFVDTFSCNAQNITHVCSGNEINVSAINLTPILKSNVNAVHLRGSPFSLTCSLPLSTFTIVPQNQTYSVFFYSSRDGRLAVYDVDGISLIYFY